MTLTVVIGLPGSGKTYYRKTMLDDGTLEEFYDDYQARAIDNSDNPRCSRYYGTMIAALIKGRTIGTSDVSFCRVEVLNAFEEAVREIVPDVEIRTHWFANDPAACRRNVLRNAEREALPRLALIDALYQVYHPPNDCMPVWGSDEDSG